MRRIVLSEHPAEMAAEFRARGDDDGAARWAAGARAENDTANFIGNELSDRDDWWLLQGYRGRVGEIDQILIGSGGCFCIEVKGWNGDIYVDGDRWRRRRWIGNFPGEKIEDTESASQQIKRTSARLERYLARENINLNVFRVVILAHENARIGEIQNQNIEVISTLRELDVRSVIENFNQPLEKQTVDIIVQKLREDHEYQEKIGSPRRHRQASGAAPRTVSHRTVDENETARGAAPVRGGTVHGGQAEGYQRRITRNDEQQAARHQAEEERRTAFVLIRHPLWYVAAVAGLLMLPALLAVSPTPFGTWIDEVWEVRSYGSFGWFVHGAASLVFSLAVCLLLRRALGMPAVPGSFMGLVVLLVLFISVSSLLSNLFSLSALPEQGDQVPRSQQLDLQAPVVQSDEERAATDAVSAPGDQLEEEYISPSPTPLAATPVPTSTFRIGNTDGLGVAVRDACDDDARASAPGRGIPESTVVELIAPGEGDCAEWMYVRASDGRDSWVRSRYLKEIMSTAD